MKRQQPEGTGELFYVDDEGRKHDAALHAEILADDEMPWDIDLDAFGRMTEEEQDAYLARRDELMRRDDPS